MLTTILFILLCILQINDVGTTYYMLTRGKAREANPVMRWLMKQLGIGWALVLAKLVVMPLLWYWGNAIVLGILCLVYGWVVWRNLELVYRAGQR